MEQHLSQYRIFYEVARCGNISRAAKELYISQPAISKAVSKLEESLGTKLFNRNSRGVQLTHEGQVLYQHIDAAFAAIVRGEKELRRIHEFHIGQLKIGVSNTLCKYVLLPYLKGFVEKYPHVNISIESQSTIHTLEMLEAKKIDIGLVAEPKSRKTLAFTPVMSIHDAFVCTPSYMENLLLREGKNPDIFRSGNIILLERSNMSRKHIDSYLAESQIEINQLLEVSDMTMAIDFARTGLGISYVIRDFVTEELETGTLMEVPLDVSIPSRIVGFSYSPQDMPETVRDFLNFCKTFKRH